MVRLCTIITGFIFFSCLTKLKEGGPLPLQIPDTKSVIIRLEDSLGEVRLTIPVDFDTSFRWIHHSDCSSCGYKKYRLQPRSLPVHKESGWFYDLPKDSVEQLTVSYHQKVEIRNGTSENTIWDLHAAAKQELDAFTLSNKPICDTFLLVRNRPVSIVAFRGQDTSKRYQTASVTASTTIKGNAVRFSYQLATKNNDSLLNAFVQRSKELLQTISIQNGL
jgi:hypothetical protein